MEIQGYKLQSQGYELEDAALLILFCGICQLFFFGIKDV